MGNVVNSAFRAGRHLAVWLVWHSTGTSLIADE